MKIDKQTDKIKDFAKALKLPYTIRNIEEEIKEANKNNLTYEDFLLSILESESDLRKANGIKSRIRLAKFPYKKYIEDLSLQDLPQDARDKVKVFSSLGFIETGQNIILAGNPGTGKTHMAIGLGIKACNKGYKVLFTTIPLLVNELKECRSDRTLRAFENRFEKYDLIIADELCKALHNSSYGKLFIM